MGGLTDLCGVVNDSAAVNIAQPTGLEDGSVVVTTYDWQNYFSQFHTKVKGIKKLHHLRFESASPGCIFVKERAGSTEVKRNILKNKSWKPTADQLPPVLPPSGLSLQRQWYLYEKIREFCPDHLKDTTCPRPGESVQDFLPPRPIPHLQLPPSRPPHLPLTPPQLSHLLLSEQDFVDSAGSQDIMLGLVLNHNFYFSFHVLLHTHTHTHTVHTHQVCHLRPVVSIKPHLAPQLRGT